MMRRTGCRFLSLSQFFLFSHQTVPILSSSKVLGKRAAKVSITPGEGDFGGDVSVDSLLELGKLQSRIHQNARSSDGIPKSSLKDSSDSIKSKSLRDRPSGDSRSFSLIAPPAASQRTKKSIPSKREDKDVLNSMYDNQNTEELMALYQDTEDLESLLTSIRPNGKAIRELTQKFQEKKSISHKGKGKEMVDSSSFSARDYFDHDEDEHQAVDDDSSTFALSKTSELKKKRGKKDKAVDVVDDSDRVSKRIASEGATTVEFNFGDTTFSSPGDSASQNLAKMRVAHQRSASDKKLKGPLKTSRPMNDNDESDSAQKSPASVLQADSESFSNTNLTNPFRGLHEHLTRSYRLDQLLHEACPEDLVLARQEKKSAAFSFLRFASGPSFYESHWNTLPELLAQHNQEIFASHTRGSRHHGNGKISSPIPGLTLFNNNLGLDDIRVQHSFPLLVAQRLLLFPDHMRHFHTLCGREEIPCDFYADVDLPDETPENGEKVLLDIINYLEVRLPGVGFTDPFFLVLTNEVPSSDKVSYHIHARSMTNHYLLGNVRSQLNNSSQGDYDFGSSSLDGDEVEEAEDEAVAADFASMIPSSKKSKKDKKKPKKKEASNTPRTIAFHDYRAVKLLADEINQTLGQNVIDDQCYRAHGMLRCAFSGKITTNSTTDRSNMGTKKRLVPLLQARDSELQKKLSSMESVLRCMTDPEILELTFCNRFQNNALSQKIVEKNLNAALALKPDYIANTIPNENKNYDIFADIAHGHKFKLLRAKHILGPKSGEVAQEYDMYGNLVSPYLTEAAKWRRYKAVTEKLRRLPPRLAETYDIWVRVGLALHNFSNEDHVFEEWVKFSLKCPQKYSREACRKKWIQFERNPDALNWRRGYNYLNSTLWRSVND